MRQKNGLDKRKSEEYPGKGESQKEKNGRTSLLVMCEAQPPTRSRPVGGRLG